MVKMANFTFFFGHTYTKDNLRNQKGPPEIGILKKDPQIHKFGALAKERFCSP